MTEQQTPASVVERLREAIDAKRKQFEDRSSDLKPGSPARHFVSGRENGLADALCIIDAITQGESRQTGWQDIATAPKDGTTVRVGKRKFFQQAPVFPLKARFLDGRWLTDFGNDTWRSFDPQPNCWMPLPAAPTPADGGGE